MEFQQAKRLEVRTLQNIQIETLRKVHFIGISSSFSSFSANVLYNRGVHLTASEYDQGNEQGEYWREKGILYPEGHNAEYVTPDIDLVVFPNAPSLDNPEVEQTYKLNLPHICSAELLGLVTREYRTIAVTGTHGKTTTTAMIIWLLTQTVGEPNYAACDKDQIIGLNKSINLTSETDLFVLEADEYMEKFLLTTPNPWISVVTHVDLDHTDYFEDQAAYNEAFKKFLLPTRNTIVVDLSGNNESAIVDQLQAMRKDLDIIDVRLHKQVMKEFDLQFPGTHNLLNGLKAYLVGMQLNIPRHDILEALNSYKGVTRRFEYIGENASNNLLYKDYAHNPQKIKACLESVQEKHPHRRKILVFEPHSIERCYSFSREFAIAIEKADVVIVVNIYTPIREQSNPRYDHLISSEEFAEHLQTHNSDKPVSFAGSMERAFEMLSSIEQNDSDVIVFASAGILHQEVDMRMEVPAKSIPITTS